MYGRLREGIRKRHSEKYMALTCSIIMLPLFQKKRQLEKIIDKFQEIVSLHNSKLHYDWTVAKNLQKISYDRIDPQKQKKFMASYLRTLPFLNRLTFAQILDKLLANQISVLSLQKGDLVDITAQN